MIDVDVSVSCIATELYEGEDILNGIAAVTQSSVRDVITKIRNLQPSEYGEL